MTAPITQTEEKPTAGAPTPLIAAETAPHALVEERPIAAPAFVVPAGSVSPTPSKQVTPPQPVSGLAGWLSRHRSFTKEPFSYIGYQLVRAAIATVPYGFGMAAGHHLFNLMSAHGQKMGYEPEGIKAFANGIEVVKKAKVEEVVNGVKTIVEKDVVSMAKGLAAVEGVAKFEKPGFTGTLGRNMTRLGNSPLNAAVQIALGFTMFRFAGGVVKNLRDRVMNEKNTPEQTAKEVKHAPRTIWESMKINWPAEATGTPIAALVLGFMNAAYTPTHLMPKRDLSKPFWKQAHEVVLTRPAKLLQNAAVWTLSYSLFFLTAESLFKDKQIQRGHWKGHPNSLKNGPDDTVGGPGAAIFSAPENDSTKKDPTKPVMISASAEEGYKQVVEDDRAHDSHDKLRYPWLTGEPSMGRFVFRRVLPVAVGISAYAALKRVGYMADIKLPGMKYNYLADAEKGITGAWNGPMEPITVAALEKLDNAGTVMGKVANHAKFFGKNTYREGKATVMFGALWMATDAWGTWYDKFVHKLQKPENAVPLNEHQQANHAELLARLSEKDKNQGRAA